MSRMVMKNGDVVNLETYDWRAYRSSVQLAVIARELRTKAEQCKNDYPGQKVSFCFNSEFGVVPDEVKKEEHESDVCSSFKAMETCRIYCTCSLTNFATRSRAAPN